MHPYLITDYTHVFPSSPENPSEHSSSPKDMLPRLPKSRLVMLPLFVLLSQLLLRILIHCSKFRLLPNHLVSSELNLKLFSWPIEYTEQSLTKLWRFSFLNS